MTIVETETRYVPSAEQLELGSTIHGSLAELLPLARLHVSFQESPKVWASLEELGIFEIVLPQEQGGSGLGAVEEALIVMSLGSLLASPAVLATLSAAHWELPGNSAGPSVRRTAAAYRHAGRIVVVQEPEASLILVRDRDGASVHDARTCESRPLDERLWLAALGEAAQIGEPLARLSAAQLARLRLNDAAALAGAAQATLEMSVAYAGTREQFGRPIGSFQAVKHHCANMAMAARCARDQTSFAAVALDEQRTDALLQIECAFFVAASAALENARLNIQIHGGLGFSDEADPHLFLKRTQLLIAIAGGLEASSRRIAEIKGGL